MRFSNSRRILQIFAVVLPVLFVTALDLGRHLLFPDTVYTLWGTLGMVSVLSLGTLAFSQFVFGVLDRLQGRIVTQNRQLTELYGRVSDQARQLKALHCVALGLIGELDTNALLTRIVKVSRELVSAKYAALAITDAAGSITKFFSDGIDEETRRQIGNYPIGKGTVGYVLREGLSLRVSDLFTDPRFEGFPPNHPIIRSFLGVPLKMKGATIGALYLAEKIGAEEFTVDDQELVSLLASQAAVAIENAKLYQEAMAVAAMKERERIAHDLHDSIIQSLYAVGLSLERAMRRLEREPEEAQRRIAASIEEINAVMRDIRNYIFGLGSADSDDLDLSTALHRVLREFEVNSLATAHLDMAQDLPELSLEARSRVIHFVREALANVLKHASATQVWISMSTEAGWLTVKVRDNGRGFDTSSTTKSRGYGLRSMAERAKASKGMLRIDSSLGSGTEVTLQLPMEHVIGIG